MPPTLEVACRNDTCALDMFEVAYTYEMVGQVDINDLCCPLCEQTESLERLFYTYEDSR